MIIGRERCLEALEHTARHLATVLAEHPAAAVPRYPGQDVEALARHVITIHEWVAALVAEHSQEFVPQSPPPESLSGRALRVRFDAAWGRLLEVLAAADESVPMWSFGSDRTVGFWQRRMAHETSMHAWDAESAIAERPAPIPLDLAVTGLGEGLRIHVQRPLRKTEVGGSGETIGIECTDADADWTVTLLDVGVGVEDGVAHPEARLGGSASDLWLGMTGRSTALPLARLGDETVLERFESALATIRDAM
jgi:uncharacterized protein (TIGR03083 family)